MSESERLSLRQALESVVAAYNGTLSGEASPHALAVAVVNAESALAAPDEAVASRFPSTRTMADIPSEFKVQNVGEFIDEID